MVRAGSALYCGIVSMIVLSPVRSFRVAEPQESKCTWKVGRGPSFPHSSYAASSFIIHLSPSPSLFLLCAHQPPAGALVASPCPACVPQLSVAAQASGGAPGASTTGCGGICAFAAGVLPRAWLSLLAEFSRKVPPKKDLSGGGNTRACAGAGFAWSGLAGGVGEGILPPSACCARMTISISSSLSITSNCCFPCSGEGSNRSSVLASCLSPAT